MCLKLLSKLLTKKDDMPKPNDFVYSSDYRQPYIYEIIETSVNAPATSEMMYRTRVTIPNKYPHRPLVFGYASTDPNFSDKRPIGGELWEEKKEGISSVWYNTYYTEDESYDDRLEIGTIAYPNFGTIPAKKVYFRIFLINRLNDSVPGKRQIVPKGNFNLNTDLSNIQIYKEGTVTLPAGQVSIRIPHDLGYAPMVLAWHENDCYPSHLERGYFTNFSDGFTISKKDYIEFNINYADDMDWIFYYMILTERIPDGQSS